MSYPNDINVELIPEFVKICDWLQANKLSLNILKTEYMVIGTEQMLTQIGSIPKTKIGSFYLKRVVKTKSLGLIIDDNLKMGRAHRLYLLQDKTERWRYQQKKGCDTHWIVHSTLQISCGTILQIW